MLLSRAVPLLISYAAVLIVEASTLRGGGPEGAGRSAILEAKRAEYLRAAVLNATGGETGVAARRLKALENMLRPVFLSMPKNDKSKLDHGSTRYVLHRLFLQRHGMYVKGLEPRGQGWSSSSTSTATEVLEDRVPSFVQSLFEEQLAGEGMGLHDLAILTATLEHIIHEEAVERLKFCYRASNMSTEARVNTDTATKLIDDYMALFLKGSSMPEQTHADVLAARDYIEEYYPGWAESQTFGHNMLSGLMVAKANTLDFKDGQLTFSAMSAVVEEIGERYGQWQDAECRELKGGLMKLESQGSGRVLLKDFYGKALDGTWQFTESIDYLREQGALDETDPQHTSVVIPNYVAMHSNCLAASGLYSVCCLDECEALLGHLENKVAAPTATADKLAELVANLPSASVQAPRHLDQDLRRRLEEAAEHHDGVVPLHGRLFAQWLHHAYPRECPFPHTAGSTNPMTADEWIQETGNDLAAGMDIRSFVEHQLGEEAVQALENAAEQKTGSEAAAANPREEGTNHASSAGNASLPWSMQEELVSSSHAGMAAQEARNKQVSLCRSLGEAIGLVVMVASGMIYLSGDVKRLRDQLSRAGGTDILLPRHVSKQHYC
jgi:hypothetical protein